MARFNRISLLIDIDHGSLPPKSLVLRAPIKIRPKVSRIIFHETVHFWQQVSQTFLARLAEEDWCRLKTFETRGRIEQPGPVRTEYTRVYPEYDYSARDLQEGLARYWDVHVISPITLMDLEIEDEKHRIPPAVVAKYTAVKQVAAQIDPSGYPDHIFELAMSFTAGNYAKPYIHLREKTSSFVAAVLFPLAGHFALQSDQPVPFFADVLNRAIPMLKDVVQPGAKIDDVWPIWYHQIRNLAVEIHKERSDRPFYPAGVIIVNGPLNDHPIYYYVSGLLVDLINELNTKEEARQYLVPGYNHEPSMRANLSVDFYTACPGIPTVRSLLISHLAPPAIRFSDGCIWSLRMTHLAESYPEMGEKEASRIERDLRTVADQAVELDDRWRRFRLACLGLS